MADNDNIPVSSTPQTPDFVVALPHLILHPFGAAPGTEQLLEGSRAAMDLQEAAISNPRYAEIHERVLLGRYQEIRMLLFLGKDVFRWIEQCLDQLSRSGEVSVKTNAQFFSALIVDSPPEPVKQKLEEWGVSDRRAVFSRGIGIRCLFEEPPDIGTLSPMFLENYHRFADYAYVCFQQMKPYQPVEGHSFDFRIFASEEYSRMLAEQWQEQES